LTSEILGLGLIGMSPENGHPYSWSAICNGYDKDLMEDCGFPVIPRYLEKQIYPDNFIHEAKVTHIWTQDKELSKHIAKASKIACTVTDFEDLIGSVDAVLLARDDAENHFHFAKPFLEAGIPIYIDKPLALSVSEANNLLGLQSYSGQIFSCSALSYADELVPDSSELASVGEIRSIVGFTPKGWDKYAVHIIDPLLGLLSDDEEVNQVSRWEAGGRTSLHVQFSSGIDAQITAFGDCVVPITLRVIGTAGCIDLKFSDSFQCFKNALQDFIASAREGKSRISVSRMLRVVSLIEMGRGVQ
jgi:predicted dehydrogenase